MHSFAPLVFDNIVDNNLELPTVFPFCSFLVGASAKWFQGSERVRCALNQDDASIYLVKGCNITCHPPELGPACSVLSTENHVTSSTRFGLNSSYVESLRAQWQKDPSSVADEWHRYFAEGDGAETTNAASPSTNAPSSAAPPAKVKPAPKGKKTMPPVKPRDGDRVEPLRGISAAIAENMEASLGMPTAMSTRVIPVKVLEENRRVTNQFLVDDARPKASFTHIIAWALVKAAKEVSAMNSGFTLLEEKPVKLVREDVNLGLAVDLPARGGGRTLVVPNIKGAQKMGFKEFFLAYNGLIAKARKNKLTAADFAGTTISLTNPGGLGTVTSAPRLMPGQGTIIAVGSIDFPAEYQATAPETLRALGVGKVMSMSSTYDHRVIQGAESGRYLKLVHEYLIGEHDFYDEIFRELTIPHHPYRLRTDRAVGSSSVLSGNLAATEKAMRVSQLIHSFRVRGSLLANVDPLDLQPRDHPELNLERYGLTIWDLDREFLTLGCLPQPIAPLRHILERLRDTYCRRMGLEYMHIHDVDKKQWLQERIERTGDELTLDEKTAILDKLSQAQGFERFLHKRYMGHKRFSIEGAETAIPMLIECFSGAASHGVTDIIIGMAHRGRLNILANVVGKSYEAIFAEFEDIDPKTTQGSGDVKYHLGARSYYRWKGRTSQDVFEEREVRIELACNPSHLEAVNPVVLGQCRARQDLSGDRARRQVVPVLIHGDAAFAGQGVVYEQLQMSELNGYRVGGSIHLIINNQIGYTTGPDRARTSPNCSDLARAIFAPVFRVNGDDPEACVRAMRIAFEYRMRFGGDVILDMVCYRRHGHNEGDEPSFTQPILYRAIRQHQPTRDRYAELLVRRGDMESEKVEAIEKTTFDRLEKAFGALRERGQDAVPENGPMRPGEYDFDAEERPKTAVDEDTLRRLTERITYDPEMIDIHPRVKKNILDRRREMVFTGKENGGPGIDFGMAENLAYGSLLLEGIPVRISGQDVGRGTFAHRHAVLYDVNDGRPYIPLNFLDHSADEGAEEWHPSRFRVYDSLLSEEAVLGFEYGYSVTHPDSLVLWEAQFGDFFNGAQIQVDQFISSGNAKWGQKARVTMLLPHGYDGQGPEHSSARMERFLQMCAEENWRVCNVSTPAQYFHLLRRQAKQPKAPLILFTHKSLLRAEDASSSLNELATGEFDKVVDDPDQPETGTVRRIVMCSGKIYWELKRTRLALQKENPDATKDVALVRVEQIYPFPVDELRTVFDRYAGAELVWLQEEPENMGAWTFMEDKLRKADFDVKYVGRQSSASPATGSKRRHEKQQKEVIAIGFSDRVGCADCGIESEKD
ncbi:MAG: multifunctional oxoglutarate decarboxylase/oxoglutarate dehydrogenase thiamine pyrophosphate-binding subunit/dihydrolipoyllysine-residue succinyltransferase subunit [Deltaproteobacteria bacterium]|nr:multifunctional oxoglutarate decarboxylase/oxoglutarate dehydrogenase thiamine pyrophosphate-binding subunit/dihydrolipoyllysine-residue succinyltransferase subunit [Deltaproteobacteria bacterium]